MCESNAYLRKEGNEELVLENVTFVRPEKGGLLMSSLLGDEVTINARIVEIDLMAHRIVLEES